VVQHSCARHLGIMKQIWGGDRAADTFYRSHGYERAALCAYPLSPSDGEGDDAAVPYSSGTSRFLVDNINKFAKYARARARPCRFGRRDTWTPCLACRPPPPHTHTHTHRIGGFDALIMRIAMSGASASAVGSYIDGRLEEGESRAGYLLALESSSTATRAGTSAAADGGGGMSGAGDAARSLPAAGPAEVVLLAQAVLAVCAHGCVCVCVCVLFNGRDPLHGLSRAAQQTHADGICIPARPVLAEGGVGALSLHRRCDAEELRHE
jgi:hypothetical protein